MTHLPPFFFHRLCEELDKHPLNDLYQRGQQVGPSHRKAGLCDILAFFVVGVNVDTKMERDELVELCQLVRSETFAAEKVGLEKTHHSDSNPELSVLCPCQSRFCTSELHTAQISDNKKKWICSKNQDVFDCLSPEQTLWLTGETHTHTL